MPQKAIEGVFSHVKDDFGHVTAFVFLFEMPQNRRISFSVLFLFSN